MLVNTQHPSYQEWEPYWRQCRDCYEGSKAVKKAGVLYLPPLDSHQGNASRYNSYIQRALFYNAMGRTVDGLAGAVFQKEPEVNVPGGEEGPWDQVLDNITLTQVPAELFALRTTREILTTGRYGILVDVVDTPAQARPYWTGYPAEDIVNWDVQVLNGLPTLTLVVLRERVVLASQDPFVKKVGTAYRVLTLVDGAYAVQRWVPKSFDNPELVPQAATVPLRRGTPLPFIPFTFVSPTSTEAEVQKPPLLDLSEVNLSHYRTSADLEHGRHYVALPTPWLSGAQVNAEGDVVLGPAGLLVLDKGGQAGMLEFTGAGLRALETADLEKRKMMATLGARLLEDGGGQAETATAVSMRHAGEHASLRTITGAVEQAISKALRTSVWWAQGAGAETPDALEAVEYELNKDFFAVRMSSEDLKAWVLALQAESVPFSVFWQALTEGNLVPPGVTAEEAKAEIERDRPEPPPAPAGFPAPGGPGARPPAPGARPPQPPEEE